MNRQQMMVVNNKKKIDRMIELRNLINSTDSFKALKKYWEEARKLGAEIQNARADEIDMFDLLRLVGLNNPANPSKEDEESLNKFIQRQRLKQPVHAGYPLNPLHLPHSLN